MKSISHSQLDSSKARVIRASSMFFTMRSQLDNVRSVPHHQYSTCRLAPGPAEGFGRTLAEALRKIPGKMPKIAKSAGERHRRDGA
jgi:hypothetical protein